MTSGAYLREAANSIIGQQLHEHRRFGEVTYWALGEYYSKKEARENAVKLREMHFMARVTRGSFIGSYTLWVAPAYLRKTNPRRRCR